MRRIIKHGAPVSLSLECLVGGNGDGNGIIYIDVGILNKINDQFDFCSVLLILLLSFKSSDPEFPPTWKNPRI